MRRHITMNAKPFSPVHPNRNDYDGYIEIPNDLDIPSALGWWRYHYHQYLDMGRMVRGVLATSASGCAVERQLNLNYYLASYLVTLDW
jgi:hypothetical protein